MFLGAPRMQTTIPSLKARALRLLAMREHSRAELERKLSRVRKTGEQPPDAAVLGALLDELQSLGLLDEQRFVESLVRRRQAKYGSQRIAQELRTHGLGPDAMASLVAQQPDELARALQILRKRHPDAPLSAQDRARQQRFLHARGFSSDVVRQALKQRGGAGADIDPGDDADDDART